MRQKKRWATNAEVARLAFVAVQYREQVGQAIRKRRDELGISQEEVADRIDAWFKKQGKPRRKPMIAQTISRWERGANMGRTDNLEALAAALETSVAELMSNIKRDRPTLDANAGNGGTTVEAELHGARQSLAALQEQSNEQGAAIAYLENIVRTQLVPLIENINAELDARTLEAPAATESKAAPKRTRRAASRARS